MKIAGEVHFSVSMVYARIVGNPSEIVSRRRWPEAHQRNTSICPGESIRM